MPKRWAPPDPKTAALLEEGTLNPSPGDVSDPKFQGGDFFDARDLVQVRYELLRRVSVDNVSITDAAAEYGVSRPTYYQARTNFETGGVAGLVPKKRGPRGPHKLHGEILAFAERQLVPGEPIRGRKVAALIEREFSVKVHPRTIERALGQKKTTQRASASRKQRQRRT